MVWIPNKNDDTPPIAMARTRARRAAEDEFRRLLYVAMTRAAERLVICGSDGKNKRPDGCWYNLVTAALKDHCEEEPADIADGTVWRYRKSPAPPEALELFPTAAETPLANAPPDWLTGEVSVEAAPASLSPSQAYDETTPWAKVDAETRRRALEKGVAVHRLLQSLPAIAPADRADAARRYLARSRGGFTDAECDALAKQVLRVIEDPRFSELFSAASLAEVPIVGRVTIGGVARPVAGVVDRLVVTEGAILLADFKTNRDPPRTLAAAPKPYVAQLALYRVVLRKLYPGRTVRAVLVWTEGPDLMEVSDAVMDEALTALTPP